MLSATLVNKGESHLRKKYNLRQQRLGYFYCLGTKKRHKYNYLKYMVIGNRDKEPTSYYHEEIWCFNCKRPILQTISTQESHRWTLDSKLAS